MLLRLAPLMPAIAANALDEQEVYRRKDVPRRRLARKFPRGGLICPICGARARRFMPFGLHGRPNAVCPSCGSLERHRFLWLFLQRHANALKGRRAVLHTAPESFLEKPLRARHGRRYVSVDAHAPNADRRADLTNLPFADGAFDVVLSSHVLEHVQDDRAALAEIARVLKPSGAAVLLFPFDPRRPTAEDPANDTPAKRLAAYGHPFHYRVYGPDVVERFADAGLSTRRTDSAAMLTPHQRRQMRINRNYLFFLTKKPR